MGLLRKIQIYGDSILKGIELEDQTQKYIVPKESGWQYLEEEYPLAIVNRAKFGCTVTKGLEQLSRALEKGLSCDAVVLEYGGNDCDYNWAEIAAHPDREHFPNTPLPEFVHCCREMIERLRKNGILPIIMSLPPIDAQRYFHWFSRGLDQSAILSWLGGDIQTIYRHQEMYSNALTRTALECRAPLVDVRTPFLTVKNCGDLLCADGIHPNREGHRLMGQVFGEFAARHLQPV